MFTGLRDGKCPVWWSWGYGYPERQTPEALWGSLAQRWQELPRVTSGTWGEGNMALTFSNAQYLLQLDNSPLYPGSMEAGEGLKDLPESR